MVTKHRLAFLGGFFAQLLCSQAGYGDPATVDKSAYWLFNPVPDDQMRDFNPDRPGKTHSATTVDAGHFQVEADFINYTYDRYAQDNHFQRSYSFAAPIIKAGLTDDVDVEMALAPLNIVQDKDLASNRTDTARGFGDVWLGSKINIFGNDGGKQALAVIPFVKLPVAANNIGNGVAEYTFNIPYVIALDDIWSLTLEPAFGLLKDVNDDNHHGDYSFLVNLNRPVFSKDITVALELASEYSGDHDIANQYTLDPSLQWLITPNTQLDVGIYIGLNRAAADFNPYTGIAVRF